MKQTVMDKAFQSYGKVLTGFDFETLVEQVESNEKLIIPESGNHYIASLAFLEALDVSRWLQTEVFGGLAIQLGMCAGHNEKLTAVEYHQGSEVIIALTDCVIEVGHAYDIVKQTYDACFMSSFLLKKGQAVELYSRTLHYSPLQINSEGYLTLIALIKGTNDKMSQTDNPLLLAKNKFMLVHESRIDKIAMGAVPGFITDIRTG